MPIAQPHKTILQRKLSNSPRFDTTIAQHSGRWAQTFVASAAETLGLSLTMGRRHALRSKAQDLPAILSDISMFIWADGPDGQSAFVGLDAAFLSAVLEIQTIGRVVGRASTHRPPSPTDFALVAPYVEAVFNRAGTQDIITSGLRPRRQLPHLDAVLQALNHHDTTVCVMSFRLADTDVTGRCVVGYPQPKQTSSARDPSKALATLCPELESLRSDLWVELHKFPTTLSHLKSLKVGDYLVLPSDVLGAVRLKSGENGPTFDAELGKAGSRRAVRLMALGDEAPVYTDTLAADVAEDPAPIEENFEFGDDLDALLDKDWLEAMDDHEKTARPTGTGG